MKSTKHRGKVMVITGATSGIGRTTAIEWARLGGSVVLAARSHEVLEQVAAECEEAGGEALIFPVDVTSEEEVNKLAEEAVSTYGKIDIWLNNAAAMIFGGFTQIPSAEFSRILETNLFGIVWGTRAAINQFRRQGYGTLINMGSLAGIVGQPYSTPYSISKAGIKALGISLGQELKNEPHIHVCTVHPSIVDTPIFQKAANFTGLAVNPPTSATPAIEVAKAILKLIKHPQQEVFVGKRNMLIRMNRKLAPKLFDKIYRKVMETIEMQDVSAPTTSGNLFEPIPEHASISGGWLEKERLGGRTTIKKITIQTLIVTGLLVGTGWLLSNRQKIT